MNISKQTEFLHECFRIPDEFSLIRRGITECSRIHPNSKIWMYLQLIRFRCNQGFRQIFKMKRRQCWLYHCHFEFTKCRCFFTRGKGNNSNYNCSREKDEIMRERIKLFIYFRNWEICSQVLSRCNYTV